jgi:hypothetical protein
MGHPSDGEAWKVLTGFVVDFTSDARNVRFGLATDGFDPFSTTPHHTLAGPSLLCHTTYHHLFV